MKKIYSFVLMAAALLIGANAQAATIDVSEMDQLQTAISNASNGDVIRITSALDEVAFGGQLLLNQDKYITLDLNGKILSINNTTGTQNAGILIQRGRLEIKNGTLSNASASTYDLIRLNGGGATVEIDAATQTPYSQVIIDADVLVENEETNAISITEATGTNNLANGARIDVYGELSAGKYGIKVNGSVIRPSSSDAHSPYVYIHEDANVHVSATGTKAVAAYSSGFARWLIKGYCGGSTGLYVKGGQVVLEDAIVTSLNDQVQAPVGQGSGINAGGSAIVVESNSAYPGAISVTITGNTEVSATKGYAIEETITTSSETKVDLINIQGGVISGGQAGAIVVEDKTVQDSNNQKTGKVVIAGGDVEGNIKVDIESGTQPSETQEPPRDFATITLAELVEDYVTVPNTATATTITVDDKQVIVFVPTADDPYAVTLNDAYLATFSAEKAVTIPAGLKAYGAGNIVNDELQLTEISDGISAVNIPAGTAVILYNENQNQKDYSLAVTSSNDLFNPQSITNNLKPALAWLASYANNAYILHGSELYLYTGNKMKANKAFLPIADPTSAPQRIRMVFHETEQATEIGNLEVESVKAVKFVENGEILIRRGENVYNLQGQIVK
jgi:hypothetical protein